MLRSTEQTNIDDIVASRIKFNATIYLPIHEALQELKKRRANQVLKKRMAGLFGSDIPGPFAKSPRAVIFRQGITPNHEIARFISVADAIKMRPLFFNHTVDKFVANNEWKYYLGRLYFYKGTGRKAKVERIKVVDFNKFDGASLPDVQTVWGETLINFHRRLFKVTYPELDPNIFNASEWLSRHGSSAKQYYKTFLLLFIRHGILFENFLLDKRELGFVKSVILPAFFEATRLTGLKPLIVSLEPTDIEGEGFWMFHPYESKKTVEALISGYKSTHATK